MSITDMVRPQSGGSLDQLIGAGLRSLDITAREHDLVVQRYQAVGATLDAHWESSPGDNVVSPQGSFLLGTVIRPVLREDEVDIDSVVRKDVLKTSVTQEELKSDVGMGLRRHASAESLRPGLSESDRCWTLQWDGMHMDVLPAIPNPDAYSGSALLITDRSLRAWQHSDPYGYAEWFRSKMASEFVRERELLAKRLQVDDVPSWTVKTTLQQTVQALKRHRDLYFVDELDARPASIIITTLAALAYDGGGDLYDTLRAVSSRMPEFLTVVSGAWWLANPVQPQENFADRWAIEPDRAARFFEWADVVSNDFAALGTGSGLHITVPRLGGLFGQRAATAAAAALSENLFSARTSGGLGMQTGTGTLAVRPVDDEFTKSSATRPVRDHGFYGGKR
jgi:hypothetical protein